MKSLFSILGIILIASLVAISLPRQFHAKTSNLIVNADIERVNWLHQPNNWSHNSWGHNTSRFSVDVGNNSEHGLKISISDYQNGDAKWYFNPINYITDGQYEYKEGYQSTTTSWLVAEFTLTGSNKKVYQELAELPPSASWQNVHVVFMAPTTGGQVTIYHLVKSNGTLASDNFSLERVGYINLLNFVPNPSLEIPEAATIEQPAGWQPIYPGSARYSYPNEGYLGAYSLKIEQSIDSANQKSAWSFVPVAITAGKTYELSDYSMSNVATQLSVQIVRTNGQRADIPLLTAPANQEWQYNNARFTAPDDAVSATIVHALTQPGYLMTDDYSLKIAENGFNRPLVTLTFDDNWQSVYTNAAPIMKRYNMKSTQYVITNVLNQKNYMTAREIRTLIKNGHEITSHTLTHPDLTTLPPDKLDNELSQSKKELQERFGVESQNFASPFGAANDTSLSVIKKYYESHRSSEEGYNTETNFNRYNLLAKTITAQTTPQEFASWLDEAEADHSWLILVYHEVNTSQHLYSVSPHDFTNELGQIQARHLTVLPLQAALNEIRPQISAHK